MLLPRFIIWIFPVGMMALAAATVCGQDYPNKPVRILTSEIGGGSDFGARLIAPALGARLGQQMVIENRVAQIAIETAVKAPADGYTLLFIGSPLWILPFLRSNLPYDPMRDIAPISQAASAASILVVHPSLPVKSVKELIALAKAQPGQLNFASGSTGSSTHIAGELFKSMAGVNIVGIVYKSTGPALIDLLGGHVQLQFASAGPVAAHIKSGRLRALAVTSAQPSALAPGLPTVAASGVPGYESASIQGLFAASGTPAATLTRLNREIVQVLIQPAMKEKFFNSGVEAVGNTPEEFAATIKSEVSRVGKVIKDSGIRAE